MAENSIAKIIAIGTILFMDASGSETSTGPDSHDLLLYEKSHEGVLREPFLREAKRLRGLNNYYKNLLIFKYHMN
jgi:hypothetical protein